jgi:hypothetical protein
VPYDAGTLEELEPLLWPLQVHLESTPERQATEIE